MYVCLDCCEKSCLQECGLMNKLVDQHNPCVLVIMPSLVLLAFSPNKVTWHLLYFQNVLFSKTGGKTYF
jgi:hypothetical protein